MIAVVVAYKNGQELTLCLNQLLAISMLTKVIVVDNSYYEAGSALSNIKIRSDEKLIYVIPPQNLGYSGGNNFGIAQAKRYGDSRILICNPDVLIDGETLVGLNMEMNDKSLHLLSPFMIEPHDDSLTKEFRWPGWDLWLGRGVVQIPRGTNRKRYLPSFYGACFVVDVNLLETIGPLNESLFLYCEELDYCQRMLDRRFLWGISEKWGVFHDRGSSISPSGGPNKSVVSMLHSSRSAVIVGRTYWPVRAVAWTIVRSLWALHFFLKNNPKNGKAIILGLHSGWILALKK